MGLTTGDRPVVLGDGSAELTELPAKIIAGRV